MTMEKFGERLGVKKNTVSQWENGINSLSEQMLKSICREYNVNEEWLRSGTGNMFYVPEDETAAIVSGMLENPGNEFYDLILSIIKTYEQLTPESKKVFEEICKKIGENKENRKA